MISAGLRALIKKVSQYTIDRFNGGRIGPKRVKHTHIRASDGPIVGKKATLYVVDDPMLKCPVCDGTNGPPVCGVCGACAKHPCDAGLHG